MTTELGGIDDPVGDDHISTNRQAVHEDCIVRSCHLCLRRRSSLSRMLRSIGDIRLGVAVKFFAAPAFCVDDIDAVERLRRHRW